ncbi:DsbA family protein [Vibrio hannami]|uniref:DsbA family protein n=1 Tax=Vibrio hannami TaxID=2717094 RepID=UPI002410A9D9|nr:DsbA family protein [Vibrio hannami]MDG3085909.1 DsbA family protein [Vibrio hannami]
MSQKLYYVYDPMCAWCWGYRPTWKQIESELSQHLEVEYVLGGLAADSDVPMPEDLQRTIASYWQRIHDLLGTEFNFDFWSNNTPRRSTYPSCRAVLAARYQGKEKEMILAVQQAYYLQALNPSDNSVLIGLAKDIGLDMAKFEADLLSESTKQALLDEISFARSIGGNSFPSLFVRKDNRLHELPINYQDAKETVAQVLKIIT